MNPTISPEWAERIAQAQAQTHINIGGKTYPRQPYGNEYPGTALKPMCRDCGVKHGQLHVLTCCIERCPACGGQALSCLCPDGEALVAQ